MGQGEMPKCEIIEAFDREDAIVGFQQKFMAIEIKSCIPYTTDRFLKHLYKLQENKRKQYLQLQDEMTENTALYIEVKDNLFTLNTLVNKYEYMLKEKGGE